MQPCKAYIISAIICGDKAIWLALPKLAKGLVLHALVSLGDDEPISPILCSILQVDPPFLFLSQWDQKFHEVEIVCLF